MNRPISFHDHQDKSRMIYALLNIARKASNKKDLVRLCHLCGFKYENGKEYIDFVSDMIVTKKTLGEIRKIVEGMGLNYIVEAVDNDKYYKEAKFP